MTRWLTGLAVLLTALGLGRVAVAAEDVASAPGSTYKRPPDRAEGYDKIAAFANRLADELDLSDLARKQLRMQLLIQARSESGARNLVGLGMPERYPEWTDSAGKEPTTTTAAKIKALEAKGQKRTKAEDKELASLRRTFRLRTYEAKAAEKGYDRRDSYVESPYPRSEWVFGSGGYYGQLPSSALSSFRPGKSGHQALKDGLVHPHDVFDGWRSSVFQADFIRRVMLLPHFRNLPPEERNMKAIRRAAAALSLVKDYQGTQSARAKSVNANAYKMAAKHGFSKADVNRRLSRELIDKWPEGGAWELIQRGEAVSQGGETA